MSAEQSPVEDMPDEASPSNAPREERVNGNTGSEDDDDVTNSSRRRNTGGDNGDEEEGNDDLFGDEDEDPEPEKPARRQLDDAELDSGDDEGRADRAPEEETEQFEEREFVSMDLEIPRQAAPEPSDGEMYLLKVPGFMSIEPQAWQTTAFQPPTTDHHSKLPPSSAFSAFNTAMTTIRWRHSPSNPSELQSNAKINRWSDGSLTLQLASDPNVQYEIGGNPLAPRQRNPLKPTPTSINNAGQKGGREGALDNEQYNFQQDAFTYLVMPLEQAEALRVSHKLTAGLTVEQTEQGDDDAIMKLQAALANAANATKVAGATGQLEVTEVDPELQRKRAEEAEKQQMRNRKKMENAQERERLRADRALGRSGLSSGRYGGLNVGMLEDEEMEGGTRGRMPGRQRAKPRRRRNSEYSEDEDNGRRHFTKEDSYEMDDFVTGSDEEPEIVDDDDDDDDDDDGIIEESRERTPKRSRPEPAGDDDADAEGEPEEDVPQASRQKRRRIVDEDDDDE